MDRPGVRRDPEGSGEQGKMEETGCENIGGAPTTLAVEGLMMMTASNRFFLSLSVVNISRARVIVIIIIIITIIIWTMLLP